MPLEPLRPDQLRHLESLEWLHSRRDEDRRSGRSTVLAIHYLRRMCRGDTERDGWVSVEDHHDGRESDERLIRFIHQLGRELGLDIEVQSRHRIRLTSQGSRLNHRAMDELISLINRQPYIPPEPDPTFSNSRVTPARVPPPPAKAPVVPSPPAPTMWERLLD